MLDLVLELIAKITNMFPYNNDGDKKQGYSSVQQPTGFKQGFYYHQKCNCTVVVEGQRMGGRIRLGDIKYVTSINAESTSLLYISLPVSVTSLHDGAIVSP